MYTHAKQHEQKASQMGENSLSVGGGGVDGLGACVRNQGLTFDLLYPFNVLFLKRLQNVIYNYQEVY